MDDSFFKYPIMAIILCCLVLFSMLVLEIVEKKQAERVHIIDRIVITVDGEKRTLKNLNCMPNKNVLNCQGAALKSVSNNVFEFGDVENQEQ